MKDDIISFLALKEANIETVSSVIRKGQRVVTLQKKLTVMYCPICSHRMYSRGIYKRVINHPVMQDGMQLVLILNQRRWRCSNPACRHSMNDEFSFIEPYRRITNATDLMIVNAFKDPGMTAAQIARTFRVSDTHAIITFARYVDMPQRQLTEAICIDEVHVDINYKCKYALVIQDFISGEPIDMLPSRREEITEPYFANIPLKQRARVKYLVTDMYRPYHGFVDKYFPNAVSVIDSFHVVKMINHELHQYMLRIMRRYRERDEIRHEELEQKLGRRIEFTPSREYYLLKKYQWLILKNNDEVNYAQPPRYNTKLRRNVTIAEIENMLFDIDPNLAELRKLKEKYIHFNKQFGGKHSEAADRLRYIIEDYRNCPYPMFHKIADSLAYHREAIVNSFLMVERHLEGEDHIKQLSNGPAEALNRIVKDMKRNGRGYQNFSHLRNRFLFSQRENAAILGVPRPLEETANPTSKSRGPYRKKEKE